MNKKEEAQFWQAVGFKKRRRIYGGGGRRTVTCSPDNKVWDSCSEPHWPPMNAEQFFEWVVPALLRAGENPLILRIEETNNRPYHYDDCIALYYKDAATVLGVEV